MGKGLKWPDLHLQPINLLSMALVEKTRKAPESEQKAHKKEFTTVDINKIEEILKRR